MSCTTGVSRGPGLAMHHKFSFSRQEVDEPAPNFIVVYDLQSGTLFKKWKPGVNIISIAISSAGSCVIVGLEDSKLMAYDLITGSEPLWLVLLCPPFLLPEWLLIPPRVIFHILS